MNLYPVSNKHIHSETADMSRGAENGGCYHHEAQVPKNTTLLSYIHSYGCSLLTHLSFKEKLGQILKMQEQVCAVALNKHLRNDHRGTH